LSESTNSFEDKPDPYGEWVLLLGTSQVPDGPPPAIDEEFLGGDTG
jgi:hypothetical protein